MSVLSLHPAKILTTGEGGAVLTDRDDLADRLRRFRNHGIATELAARRDWTYDMVELGFNYRLTDIGAALGSSQLARIGDVPRRPPRGSPPATSSASPATSCSTRRSWPPGADPAWHFAFVQLRLDRLRRRPRQRCSARCGPRASASNVHYIPVHRHSFYRARFPGVSMPVAEAAYERLLTLPLFASMTDRRPGRRGRRAGQGDRRLPGAADARCGPWRSSRRAMGSTRLPGKVLEPDRRHDR